MQNHALTHPKKHDDFELVSDPQDIMNKNWKYLQETIDLDALNKILCKDDPGKSPDSKKN